MLTGVIVNTAAIIVGSLLGVLLGKHFPKRLSDAILTGSSLCVIYIGIDGVTSGTNALIVILSMVIGAIIGELLQLDSRLHTLGDRLEQRFSQNGPSRISEGFVSGSLLFCVGAMAVVGALNSGLIGDHSTLYAKSILDGVISLVFATTMGIGVAFSAAAVFLYQGLIAVCASFAAPYLGDAVISNMKCVGSLLILGLGLNMLGITKIKVMNYVPAIFFPILFCLFIQ